METPSTTDGPDAEINESTSSMSCLNDFETFADEVRGEIPEVDCRGRLKSDNVTLYEEESSNSMSQSQVFKMDKPVNFFKSLLPARTPYEDFHRLFKTVPKDQFPINDFSCALSREILLQGRIYISQGWFCFYSNIFGWETQVTIDCTKINSITREKTAYVVPNAILICTDDEKHFFSSFLSRETVYKLLNQVWNEIKAKSKTQKAGNQDEERNAPTSQPLSNALPSDNDECGEEAFEVTDSRESTEVNDYYTWCAGENQEETTGQSECQQKMQESTELRNVEQASEKRNTVLNTDRANNPLSISETIQTTTDLPRLYSCAGVAMLLASIAEALYSYFQVSLQLLRRITREQVFIMFTSFLIISLMLCSSFLFYRLSTLEPKILVPSSYRPKKILLQQSIHQLWKLRQEVFDAEVIRFKTILAANLNAITQVQKTLKMLEDDLATHIHRNCTLLENNVCLQI